MHKVNMLEPRLLVSKFAECIEFYTQVLRFSIGTQLDDFAILEHGAVRLQLSSVSKQSGQSTCTLWLDVDDLMQALKQIESYMGASWSPEWGPEDYSYGRREFGIRDPEGNLVILSEVS